jgi:hypothetical protein
MQDQDSRTTSPSDTDTPNRLIASSRVEGTAVFNRDGEKLGRVEHFMVDKKSGQAEYAVMSFGGLFGMGSDHYPLPWSVLDYEPGMGGYVVDLDKEKLKSGPSHRADQDPTYDSDYARAIQGHYGITWS